MNKVILIGRLTADPETRYTSGSEPTAVSRFTLAVDRRVARNEGQQTADFINCVAFGKRAEFLEKYGRKGTRFAIEGRIQTGSYTKSDGSRVWTTDVAVENIEFCESKKDTAQNAQKQTSDDFVQVSGSSLDEELPFN